MFKAEWTNKDSLDLQQTCNKLATNLQPTEGDIISREGAIECIRWGESVTDVIDRIKALPSADTVSREFYNDAVKANIRLVIENGKLKEQIESADAAQLKQTDTLIIADALRYLAQDNERHLYDRTRADALREQILQYGASMCHSADAEQVTSKLKNPCDSLLTDDSVECKEQKSKLESANAVQGEWEHWGSPFSDESEVMDTIVCSVCGARFIEPKDEPKGEYNFCPNCGARMKGGAE